jgi:DNA-binding transcriptional LysR family regulator
MDTDRISSFVAAADAGSLSKAATRLGQQLSQVSRHVHELEADLGVRLFDRTGRGVRLTAAGERFLERGKQVLREVELARAEARGAVTREPKVVRLSAPPDLSQQVLPGVLASLSERFPSLSIHARADVRRVSLIEESYDAVVRLGPLTPSDLLARKLGAVSVRLYAGPGRGLQRLEDLAAREFVRVEGVPTELSVRARGQPVKLALEGRVQVGSFSEAGEVAARTGRLVALPSFTAQPFIMRGTLSAAARWLTFPAIDVHLLRAPKHRGSTVLDALADGLIAALAEVKRVVD